MKGLHGFATVAALALSVFAGFAVAAQPCGKAVIDDWYDNGTFDRAWDCECLREAIDRLSDHSPPYSSVRNDFQRQLELRGCEGSGQAEVTATLDTRTRSPGSDVNIVVSDDPPTWAFVVAGALALGLAALAVWILSRRQRGGPGS